MTALLALIRAVSLKTWLTIAASIALAAAMIWAWNRVESLGALKQANKDSAQIVTLQGEIVTLKANLESEKARRRSEVADWVLAFVNERDSMSAALDAQQRKAAEDLKEAKARLPAYVSPLAVSRCTVPVGGVLYFNERAADANGQPSGSAIPAPDVADAPSGIAFDTFLGVVADTQGTLKDCRAQVTGWQEFWARLVSRWAGLKAKTDAPGH